MTGVSGEGVRPAITELRLSAFKSFRRTCLGLGPLTVLVGGSGAGKTNALEALGLLGRLAAGDVLGEAIKQVRGGAMACVPLGAAADAEGRRGFRVGCTVNGPIGPVRLDVAVQVTPKLRIVGERLSGAGEVLLETALRDPEQCSVQAAWHTAGLVPVTRAPLPDDRLGTSLLPLRVAGKTEGQRLVLAGAEQVVVGLRGIYTADPQPGMMRRWAEVGDGLLDGTARNLSAVVRRTQAECRVRHGLLGEALDTLCPYPVSRITVLRHSSGGVMAGLDRGPLGVMPSSVMGDGELRAMALALVLLTGPGVLAVDPAEVPDALQLLTVLAEDADRGLDRRQFRAFLELAHGMCERGHVRVVASAHDREWVMGAPGVTMAELPPQGERSP